MDACSNNLMTARFEIARLQAAIVRQISDEAASVAAGRSRPDQCAELSRLSAAARCAVSAAFPREIMYEGQRYRLGIEARLFVYVVDEAPEPLLTPLLSEGITTTAGYLSR